MLSGNGLKRLSSFRRQPQPLVVIILFQCCTLVRRTFHCQGSWRGETFERRSPESLGRGSVLLLQPSNVVAEGTAGGQRELAPLDESIVESKGLFGDLEQSPPVQQQVMETPDEPVVIFAQT